MAQWGATWAAAQEGDWHGQALWNRRATKWVPAILWLTDVLALELSLGLALAIRMTFADWWSHPVPLSDYIHLALALTVFPLGYAFWALYPGYGIHPVERMRRTVLMTLLLFGCVALEKRGGVGEL